MIYDIKIVLDGPIRTVVGQMTSFFFYWWSSLKLWLKNLIYARINIISDAEVIKN